MMVASYGVIILLVLMVQIIVISLALSHKEQTKDILRKSMLRYLNKEYTGPTANGSTFFSQTMDVVQVHVFGFILLKEK
jgi:hypothetical protein